METAQNLTMANLSNTLSERGRVWRQVWRMLRESRTGIVGLIIVLAIGFTSLFAEVLSPATPNAQDLGYRLAGPVWMTGDASHLLGTDSLGRDILSRIIYGSRVSLVVGIGAVAVSGILGVILGLVAGYSRGAWNSIIMRSADVFLAVPTMILAIVIMAVLGPSLANIIIVLGVTGWVGYARVVCAEVLSVREKEYVEAALAIGAGRTRVLLRHILPNVTASIIILSSLRIATNILSEATLSFLGLGVLPPTPTWGGMVSDGRNLVTRAWWVSAFPGLAIVIAVLGVNLLGDWLRDVLDPKLRT